MVAGPPKWQYRLHSVVKHLGSSPSAGHYIADVFRFHLAEVDYGTTLQELLKYSLTGLMLGAGGDMTIPKSTRPGEYE